MERVVRAAAGVTNTDNSTGDQTEPLLPQLPMSFNWPLFWIVVCTLICGLAAGFAWGRRWATKLHVTNPGNRSEEELLAELDLMPEKFVSLVIGREFGNYSKSKIRDVRKWDGFLDGSKQDSGDEKETVEERPSTRGKIMKREGKKSDRDSDDEDWTGESEDGEEKVAGLRSPKRLRAAATRSKDEASADEFRKQKLDALGRNEEEDDDGTLGGFIVDNADVEDEEGGLSDDEEELSDEDE